MRQFVNTKLGQMHVRVEGSGPPLLLLGAAGRSSRIFSALIPLLADRYQVFAPDIFGNGDSDALASGASITAIAGCMTELFDAHNIQRAHVYGYHTGNKIGTALAANWPARVDKLILAGQSHSLIASNEERNRIIGGRTREYFEAAGSADATARAMSAWATLQRRVGALWWPDTLFSDSGDRLQALAQARTLVMDELQSFDSTSALYEINFAYDLMTDLCRIKAPTLILEVATPDEDSKIGRQGEKMAGYIGAATVQVLHASGFRLTLEDKAAELAKMLRDFFG